MDYFGGGLHGSAGATYINPSGGVRDSRRLSGCTDIGGFRNRYGFDSNPATGEHGDAGGFHGHRDRSSVDADARAN